MDKALSRQLNVLAFAHLILGSGSLAVVGLQPALLAEGMSTSVASLMISSFAISFAISAPISQWLIGHWQRRTVIIAGLAVLGTGSLAAALVHDQGLIIAARILSGTGAGWVAPMSSALAMSLAPAEQRGRALAVVFGGVTLASVIAAPLALSLATHYGWRPVLAGLGVLSGLSAVSVACCMPFTRIGPPLATGQWLNFMREPRIVIALGVQVLQVTAIFTTFTSIVPLLTTRWHLDAQPAALCLLAFGCLGLLGNFWVRRLALSHTAETLLAASGAMMLMVFAALGSVGSAWPFGLPALLAWALAQDIYYPSQQRRMVQLQPVYPGLALAINSSALFIGMSAGAALAGWGTSYLVLAALPWLSAAMTTVALLLGTLLRPSLAPTAVSVPTKDPET